MRIFCAIRHANDPQQFYGGLWTKNFYPALRELSHEIVESQVDLLPSSRFMGIADRFTREELEVRARTTEQIVEEIRAAHRLAPVDLFLSYFYNSHFDPAGFDELRRLGIPSVNFFCNSIYQFELVASIAAKVDFSWHAERDARSSYQAVGAKPIWVQMGADPSIYHPVIGQRRAAKACFVGQRYADRDRWASALVEARVPLDLFGSGWGNLPEPSATPGDELPANYLGRKQRRPGSLGSYAQAIGDVYRRSGLIGGTTRLVRQTRHRQESRRLGTRLVSAARGRANDVTATFSSYELVLNFSNVWADGQPGSALIPHVRLRDFEAPMCRCCYLTGHTDEITQFYEVGKEIDTYHTPDELIDKSQFYLKRPEHAETLREAGHGRAVRDHTWKRRFEELFTKLECKA